MEPYQVTDQTHLIFGYQFRTQVECMTKKIRQIDQDSKRSKAVKIDFLIDFLIDFRVLPTFSPVF